MEVLLQRLMRFFVHEKVLEKASTTYPQLKIDLDKQENILPQSEVNFLACFCVFLFVVYPHTSVIVNVI